MHFKHFFLIPLLLQRLIFQAYDVWSSKSQRLKYKALRHQGPKLNRSKKRTTFYHYKFPNETFHAYMVKCV